MSEKKTLKTRNITFRVTAEEFEQIEKIASAASEDPNTWCRRIVVAESREGSGLAKNERILYGEIARLRFLVGMDSSYYLVENSQPPQPGKRSRPRPRRAARK